MNKKYATVLDDGADYRKIAEKMTSSGFVMNHSSARNYVLRVMKKFLKEISKNWEVKLSDEQLEIIVKSPLFQSGISDILKIIDNY